MLSCLQLSATTAHWEHRLELQAPVKQNTEIHSHIEQFKLNRAVPVPTRRDLGLRTLMSDWWVLSARERFELRNRVCGLLLPGHCIKQLVLCKTNGEILVQCQGEWAHFSPMHQFRTQLMRQVRRRGTYLAFILIFHSHFMDTGRQLQTKKAHGLH